MAEWMPVLVAQAWQVTLLIVAVAAINRWVGNSRPHLAHVLWLVVLVKCVTPPVWSSPSGLFCWLQPARETIWESLEAEPDLRSWSDLVAAARHTHDVDLFRRDDAVMESGVEPEESLISFGEVSNPTAEFPSPITSDKAEWLRVLLGAWGLASLVVIGVAAVRCVRCWRMLRNAPRRECAELSSQLDLLAKQLGLRRRVRLIVTESRLGPAVIGLFRATVLLPALIVDRLAQRSPVAPRQESRTSFDSNSSDESEGQPRDGISVAEQQSYGSPLVPILAHELLHIRRGDLWVGLLQTLAQAVWWCHPLVWWVNRRTTREAERCCDEEVLAELGCDPAAYARALVDVLELKRELKPVPVFPGVRPVEVTSQRLERIMQLGQGCQRRTPWWYWLIAALAAAATWPGAAFVVTAEDQGERGGVSGPVPSSLNREVDAARPPAKPSGPIGSAIEPRTSLAYEVVVFSGEEAEIQQLAKQINAKLVAKSSAPVVVERDAIQRLLKEAQATSGINLASHRAGSRDVGERSLVGDTRDIVLPGVITSPDKPAQFIETSREYGWTLTMEPVVVRNDTIRLRVLHWLGQLDHTDKVTARHPKTGEEYDVPGINERQTDTGVELRDGQALVFPVSKVPLARSKDFMLLTLQVRRTQTPRLATKAERPVVRGIGVNSDAGVTGEVVLDEPDEPIPVGNIAEIRVAGNISVPSHEILAMIKSKPGEPVSEKQMRADVRAIYASRRFWSVTPHLVRADKGVDLLFQVAERPLVERVEFRGAKQFKTQELEKLTELREGSPFDVSFNREAVQRIEERYRSRGYPWAKVELITGSQKDNRQVIFEIVEGPKVSAGTQQLPTKLKLDGLGQLAWQQGSWLIAVLPMPGSKLIDSGESPSRFRSDGRVSVYLSKAGDGFSNKDQVTISADALELSTDEDDQEILLSGDVGLRGNGFDARCQSALLKTERRPTGHEPEVFALLEGDVRIVRKVKAERTELEAKRAMLLLHGTAISQLKNDENGLVAVLRDPPDREDPLIRLGQLALARFSNEKIVSVHMENVPLKEAIKQLAKSAGRNIVLDKAGLEDESLTERVPITLALDDVKLSSALKLLLDPLNLGYRIEESGVIVVTSQQRLKGQLMVLAYSVADLAVPIPKRVVVKLAADRSVAGDQSKPSDSDKPMSSQLPELVKLITSTCQPNSWEEAGGNGRIKANDSTLSLVILQTRDVHEEIRDLLGQMRRLQQNQVALQIETWTVPDDFWERLRKLDVDLQDYPLPDSKSPAELLALPESQTNRSLAAVPKSPADAPLLRLAVLLRKEAKLLGSVCQTKHSLKFTLHNGQELELIDGLYSPPTRLILKPALFDELKRLRLHAAVMKPGDVEPDAKPDFTKCAVVLDAGNSLLLDAFPQKSSIVEEKHTTLSLNGITTKSLGKRNVNDTHRTLLLITGTVLVEEEEESLLGIPKDSN